MDNIANIKWHLTGIVLLAFSLTAVGQDGRSFSAIDQQTPIPESATAIQSAQPVPRELVEQGVNMIAAQWNTANLEEVLADEFYDAQRLEDTLLTTAPRNAILRVIAIGGHQTLQQYVLDGTRTSRVSVSVQTQVEFNNPETGFEIREGTAEWILKIIEE